MDARFAAVAQLTAALEALTAVVAQKYVKPASGIPSTDMDADVQAALAKANTAVQSLADYYTKSEVDQLLAAINGMDYVDVAALPTASASTLGKIYLVGPDASGYYAYYYTSYDGSAYSWVGPLGTTQISLTNYATKAELSQLDQEVNGGTSTQNIPIDKSNEGYRINSSNGYMTTGANRTLCLFPITFGKTYHLTIPSLTNQYTAAYGFFTKNVDYISAYATLPSTVVVGPISNYSIDITAPDQSLKYLVVTYDTDAGIPTLTTEQVTQGLVDRIEDLEGALNNIDSAPIELILPPKIYAVVGDKFELFWRTLVQVNDPYSYDIVPYVSKGQRLPRRFVYTPASGDVGDVNFGVEIHGKDGDVMISKSTTLSVVAAPTSPATAKKVLCFGASTTAGGQWPAEAFRRLTGSGGSPEGDDLSNIAFCGAMTKNGAGYFGVGGWNWYNYATAGVRAFRLQVSGVTSLSPGSVYSNNDVNWTLLEVNVTGSAGNILIYGGGGVSPTESGTLTKVSGDGDSTITFSSSSQDVSNPLWDSTNEKMTFEPYANAYSDGQIDAVYVLLGNNGIGIDTVDFSSTMAYVKTFADTLHSEFPSAKLYILGLFNPSANGGLGYNYGANGTGLSNRMGLLRSQINLNKAYAEFAASEGYANFVEYVDTATQFDCEYNYPFYEMNVNSRNSEKERIDNNGIHPADSGYYQIADVVYRHFVAKFCQS